MVCRNAQTIMMECKDGAKSPSKRVLTPDQVRFHAEWIGGPIAIVDSVEAALRVLKSCTGG